MTKLRIRLAGRRLLMDRMNDETLKGLATGNAPQIQKDRPFEQIAGEKIYRDEDGRIGLTADMLFASLVAAGRLVQYKGKSRISTLKDSLLPGFFDILDDFLVFDVPKGKKEVPWKVLTVPGRNPATGGAACLIRPLFLDWSMEVNCEFDEKLINVSRIRELFDVAGRSKGLGSWRAGCKGRHGKFKVTAWNVVSTDTENNGQAAVEDNDDLDLEAELEGAEEVMEAAVG